jgi:N-acetylmuramic acid 6-phosphate etherase
MERSTERANGEFKGLDSWPDAEILAALIGGQERAIAAAKRALPAISAAATAIADRLAEGGRLIYAGAGTSIRIAVQDGSELPATFGMNPKQLAYLIAGGRAAMFDTLAEAEDDAEAAIRECDALGIGTSDAVIAVAASGTTPYTVAAARRARERGAYAVAVVCNVNSPLASVSSAEILIDSGPEVIAGSTRMGAGTAQKAALNLLSTLVHIKLGAVHDGMMVNVQAENTKLKARAQAIVSKISGAGADDAATALRLTDGEVKPAVLVCAGAPDPAQARALLARSNGNLRLALERLAAPSLAP